MKTLDEFQGEVGEWATKTFPPPDPLTNYTGLAVHCIDESYEFHSAARDHLHMIAEVEEVDEEAADLFLILLHYAHRRGISLMEIAEKKMKVNYRRSWAFDTNKGYVAHVKEEGE